MRSDRSITAAMALTLAVSLAACSDDGPAPPDRAPTTADAGDASADPGAGTGEAAVTSAPAQATEADDDPVDDERDDDEDGVVGLGPGAETTAAGLAAVDSAVAAVGGEGPAAYALDDREDGFWEVEVLGQDGASTVTVSPDGTLVDGAEDAEEPPAAARRALAEARTSLAEAVVAATRSAEGQLEEAALAEHDGGWSWRVVVDTQDEEDVELFVDPATGTVDG